MFHKDKGGCSRGDASGTQTLATPSMKSNSYFVFGKDFGNLASYVFGATANTLRAATEVK